MPHLRNYRVASVCTEARFLLLLLRVSISTQGGQTMKRLLEESGAGLRVQEYADVARGSKQRAVMIRGSFEVRNTYTCMHGFCDDHCSDERTP